MDSSLLRSSQIPSSACTFCVLRHKARRRRGCGALHAKPRCGSSLSPPTPHPHPLASSCLDLTLTLVPQVFVYRSTFRETLTPSVSCFYPRFFSPSHSCSFPSYHSSHNLFSSLFSISIYVSVFKNSHYKTMDYNVSPKQPETSKCYFKK